MKKINLYFSLIVFIGVMHGSVYLKIGKSTTSNIIKNLEIKTDEYYDLPSTDVNETFAEVGWKSGSWKGNRFRANSMAYFGYDESLGGNYGISGYSMGMEFKFNKEEVHYFSLDWLYNSEFYDYDDFAVGEWGILDDIYTYANTGFGFSVGIGTYLNEHITLEVNYKNHNEVHFSEFPYDVLFWWGFDYKRSGYSASVSFEL